MSDSKPIFVLYHANCADGFGAAWAAWMHYKDLATYLPVSYGEPVPEGIPDGARVFIVDFSFPREVLLGLNDRCAVTVIDHHKTAEEALRGLDFARFDLTKSGAVLTWEYFHKEPVPEMLLYVQDRDLWQWKMGFSKELNACLWRGATRDFQTWRVIHQLWHAGADSSVKDLYAGGKAICLADALTIEVLVRKPAWVRVLGWMVPAVNSPVLQSEIGHELLQRHAAAPFALVWWVESDGRHGFSARARGGEDGFDVSVLAKEFGGGGHRAAAGFKRDSMFEFVGKESAEVRMQAALKSIYDMTEGCADGAPDASARDRLANEVACLAMPWAAKGKEDAI